MNNEFKEVNDKKSILITDQPTDPNPMFSCGQWIDLEDFLKEQEKAIAKRRKIANWVIGGVLLVATYGLYYFY